MNYELKAVINGVEIGELQSEVNTEDGISYRAPSITDVKLVNCTTLKTMEIGATASDCLTLTVLNPFKTSFDGDKVEFYISPVEPDELSVMELLDEEVGDEISDEVLDEDEFDSEIEEDEEEGEELTEEETEDSELAASELEMQQYMFLEGEETTSEDEDTDEGEEEAWQKVGAYYVYSQKNISGGVILTCYDGFSRMNDTYEPTEKKGTVQQIYDDLRAQVLANCDIAVDEFEFDDLHNIEIKWDFACSYRNALGFFAGIAGGFGDFDNEGNAGISFYSFTDNILLESDVISYSDSMGEILLDGISCNISADNLGTDIIETGAGQSISFNNPFVTESILEDIFTEYRGIRFTGAELTVRWDDSLVSGTFARIFTEDEYRNYLGLNNALSQEGLTDDEAFEIKSGMNSLGKVILISSQTISFSGEVTSTITSVCDSETMKECQIESPFDTKVKTAYAKADAAQSAAGEAAESASRANSLAETAQASADQAKQSADAAKTAADNAQSAVDAVEADVASLETSVNNAQAAADNAQKAADTAKTAADTAQRSAESAAAEAEAAKTNAAAAQTKADEAAGSAASAQETAEDAVTKANVAQTTASAAREEIVQANKEIDDLSTTLDTTKKTLEADYSKKTELSEAKANLQAQITENAAQIELTHTKIVEVDETANDAKDKAQAAQTAAGKAQSDAAAAKTAADNAQAAADAAKTAADTAQTDADTAKTAAANAKSVADKAQTDLEAAQADLATVFGRVDATEEDIAAAQEAVTTAQTAADKAKQDAAAAQLKAETAQSAADDAATKATAAQTKADEAKTAADDAALVASGAQTDATAAKAAAANAQKTAETAQSTATAAKTSAANAQTKADQAAADAAAAQTTADAAKTKAETAQSDLTKAKENLEAVKNRVDATEEDIAAAELAVQVAQLKADAAAASAASAQSTADLAKVDAATAQAAADKAKADAATAQTAANNAKAAADAAQEAVDALKTRVTKTETDIKKNADAIALTATKEEVTETLGGYYTKEEADAAVEVTAGGIRQEVSNTYATKQGLADANTQIETNKSQIEQTAKQLKLLIKSGDTESSLVLTDKLIELAAAGINLKGLVSFSGLDTEAQGKITDAQEEAAESAQKLASWCAENNQTLIDGSKIYTGSVGAKQINVTDLFAQDITASGTITGSTLKGSSAELTSGKIGPFALDPSGLTSTLSTNMVFNSRAVRWASYELKRFEENDSIVVFARSLSMSYIDSCSFTADVDSLTSDLPDYRAIDVDGNIVSNITALRLVPVFLAGGDIYYADGFSNLDINNAKTSAKSSGAATFGLGLQVRVAGTTSSGTVTNPTIKIKWAAQSQQAYRNGAFTDDLLSTFNPKATITVSSVDIAMTVDEFRYGALEVGKYYTHVRNILDVTDQINTRTVCLSSSGSEYLDSSARGIFAYKYVNDADGFSCPELIIHPAYTQSDNANRIRSYNWLDDPTDYDDPYTECDYTKLPLDIEASALKLNGTNVSVAGHTHDDRYYTETEINNKLKPVSVTLKSTSANVSSGSSATCKYIPALGMCFFRGYLAERSSKTYASGTAYTLWTVSDSAYRPDNRHAFAVESQSTTKIGVRINPDGEIVLIPRGATVNTGNLIYMTGWWFV